MSRHGYTEDEPWDVADMLRQAGWRQAVRNAIKGKRGQAFLRELRDALEAMPVHELAAQSFTRGGEVCALGSVMLKRGLDASAIEMVEDDDESEPVYEEAAAMLKIAPCMAAQIMYAALGHGVALIQKRYCKKAVENRRRGQFRICTLLIDVTAARPKSAECPC